MDPILIEVYTKLLQTHRVSVDEILVTPPLRDRFLNEARILLGGDTPERTLLMRLINLRKRSKLPRASDLTVTAGNN